MAVMIESGVLELQIEASDEVREALLGLGRTEDVRFAPDGHRIAIACFEQELIAVADIEISRSGAIPVVSITGLERFASTSLCEPHGLDFVDDDVIVVGNRGGGVSVFRLPAGLPGGRL